MWIFWSKFSIICISISCWTTHCSRGFFGWYWRKSKLLFIIFTSIISLIFLVSICWWRLFKSSSKVGCQLSNGKWDCSKLGWYVSRLGLHVWSRETWYWSTGVSLDCYLYLPLTETFFRTAKSYSLNHQWIPKLNVKRWFKLCLSNMVSIQSISQFKLF